MPMTKNREMLFAMGEALIDFIPQNSGMPIKEVGAFIPAVGGAPANVCGAFTKLGGKSAMITQLGADPFGDKIVEEFKKHGIDCSYVLRTDKANTSLAFVALEENGNREFSFYRKPGADMLYPKEALKKEWFEHGFGFHFCSVSLGEFPMKEAHRQAITYAREAGLLISFDPNLRPALWDSEEKMVEAVRDFYQEADILKVSDEELEIITGEKEETKAMEVLFHGNVKLVIYTKGSEGAEAYTKNVHASVTGNKVNAIDTTGAGDGFIGAFLHCLAEDEVTANMLNELTKDQLEKYLTFANRFCSKSVQKKGAIASYPLKHEMV